MNKGPFCQIFGVTLLALLSGCSTIFTHESESNDPLEQAARETRRGAAAIGPFDFVDPEKGPLLEAQIRRALRLGELTLGMRQDDVTSVWGSPQTVETAGDPRAENQRWLYFSGLSEQWSMGSRKVVYFEGGRVVGWEVH